LFSSTLFADRAPAGDVLLTTFAGGRRQPAVAALDDTELLATVEHELAELLGAHSPRWSRIIRWPRAIPQYELGHRERVGAALGAIAKVPGLHLCGSWRDGVAVGDRVVAGYAIADDVVTFLRHPAPAVPA
jgi:oxygen-dependent protoporphyrinogen oxidase